MKKRIVPVVVILLVAAVVIFYYYAAASNKNSNRADGVVEALSFTAGAEVAGTVVEIKVQEGEAVKKGDLIAVLDNEMYRQQEKVAEKKLEVIKAQIDASYDQQEIYKAQLRQTEEEIKLYQTYIDALKIKAPADGILESWLVELGQVVSPGTQLARFIDAEHPYVSAYVTQNQLAKLSVGKEVNVEITALPNKKFKGKIVWISSEAEFSPKNVLTEEEKAGLVYQVKVEFVRKPEGVLPGMTASVSW